MSIEKDEKKEVEEIPPVEESSAIPLVDGKGQLDELTNTMPEVVQDAVDAAEQKEKQIEKDNQTIVDRAGRPFDPALYAADKDGKPVLTPTGRFSKIRKPTTLNISLDQPRINAPEQATQTPGGASDAQCRATAVVAVSTSLNCMVMIMGEEWVPEKTKDMDEQKYLTDATYDYFRAKGIIDIPPGAALFAAVTFYALKRINRPVTKSRIQKMREWVSLKVANVWLWIQNKRAGKKIEKEPTK